VSLGSELVSERSLGSSATDIWRIGGMVDEMVDAAVWARRQKTSDDYRHLGDRWHSEQDGGCSSLGSSARDIRRLQALEE
jgi:hypothetical protein